MKTGTLAVVVMAIGVLGLGTTGCSRTQARTTPELPPLDVPVPPPRVVETVDPSTTPPGTLVEEPARNTVRPPVADPPRVEAPKPDPTKTDTAAPPANTTPPSADRPGATLQTTPADREPDEARRIRELLSRAHENLRRVDYNRLSAGARTQYNQARQFVKLAEDSLAARNLVFALTCADKAATLAAQLAGR